VLDRFIQQAIQQVLSPIFEPTFSDHSYGFRPGRHAHDAVRAAQAHIQAGYEWVVDLDLERFFDTVNHDRLMARLKQVVDEPRVLRLIASYLKAGVLVNGVVIETETGTPQGSPLSPLLSNIVLTELDRKLEERGLRFVRYADDCNIYVRSQRAAERVLSSTQRFIEAHLRLKVNSAKSAADHVTRRKFLGFTFFIRGGRVSIWIAPASVEKAKRKLRQLTRRSQGRSLENIRDRLNPFIVGWTNYFALADSASTFRELDQWLRRRLRQICWKQWKTGKCRYLNLRERGVSHYWAMRTAGTSKGTWHIAHSKALNFALNNAYWQEIGFKTFSQQYQLRHT
jgi:group II intron reverse transcriptase/maturase